MRSRRRGFTLVETMVAMLLTSTLVLAVFGGLTFIGRGYQRDELAMGRSRTAQPLIEQLADDLVNASGTARASAGALRFAGYEGDESTFAREPRRGYHVVSCFDADGRRPGRIEQLLYEEHQVRSGAAVALDPLSSRLLTDSTVKHPPNPWGVVRSVAVVPLPPANPDVTFVSLATMRDGRAESVLWAFWRRRRNHHDAGTVLRFGDDGGKTLSASPLVAEVLLTNEWVQVNSRRGLVLQPIDVFITIDMKETNELALPFAEPQFRLRRTLAAGL
jgi:prepilin-type N-terminal cleavage/methylation domain-containing protein